MWAIDCGDVLMEIVGMVIMAHVWCDVGGGVDVFLVGGFWCGGGDEELGVMMVWTML